MFRVRAVILTESLATDGSVVEPDTLGYIASTWEDSATIDLDDGRRVTVNMDDWGVPD